MIFRQFRRYNSTIWVTLSFTGIKKVVAYVPVGLYHVLSVFVGHNFLLGLLCKVIPETGKKCENCLTTNFLLPCVWPKDNLCLLRLVPNGTCMCVLQLHNLLRQQTQVQPVRQPTNLKPTLLTLFQPLKVLKVSVVRVLSYSSKYWLTVVVMRFKIKDQKTTHLRQARLLQYHLSLSKWVRPLRSVLYLFTPCAAWPKNPPQFAIHILWCVCLPVCVFVNIDVLCESVQIDQHVAVRSSPVWPRIIVCMVCPPNTKKGRSMILYQSINVPVWGGIGCFILCG